jgi:predicted nucleotidyltransferase
MKDLPQELLQEMTQRLVTEFQPEQVILFGSHAWGTPNEDSDVDLLVIVSNSDEKPVQRAVRGHRCLRGLMVATDILVKTRAEVEKYRSVWASLERKMLEQGKILYG